MHKIRTFLGIIICLLLTFAPNNLSGKSPVFLAAGNEEKRNILYISSYNENFLSVPDQIEGIRSVLSTEEYNVDLEYMDSKRFVSYNSRQLFHDLIKYKIEHLPPYDGIIVGDDYALQFAIDYQEELFADIPIVFLGVNDTNRVKEAEDIPYITGVVEELSIKENIQLGISLNKAAKRIVAIVDDTLTGIGDKVQYYSLEEQFPELKFEHINVSDYTFAEVENQVSRMDDDTILLYLSMYTDKTGANLTIPEASRALSRAARVPILRAEVGGIGEGILGGKMVSYYDSGAIAAKLLVKVFGGTPIDSIPIIHESPNNYIIDYNVLKKYDIPMRLLPVDTQIIGRKLSFIEQHPVLTGNIVLIFSLSALVIILLTSDNIRRRRMDKILKESHEELVQTYEELTASEEELRLQYEISQKHMEEMEILNQKYGIAVDSTGCAVWEYDVTLRTLSITEEFLYPLNPKLAEIKDIDILLDNMLCQEGKNLVLSEYNRYLNGETDKIYIELSLHNTNNEKIWVMLSGKGVFDLQGNVMSLNGLLIDITKIKEQEEYIKYLAGNDYLTKLPNRMSFMEKLDGHLKDNSYGAVLLLDIDNFKTINDTLGHLNGDRLLTIIADRINSLVDDSLKAYRFGGDEFLILITGVKSEDAVDVYLNKLRKLFNEPISLLGKEHLVSFSAGITFFPKDSIDMERLLINVDTAMYYVKSNGKGSCMFYSDSIFEDIRSKAEIEDILRGALKEDGFKLLYQPQINVNTGEIDEFEALLRLKNRNLSPARFIEIAEMSGIIIEIGRWVTKEVIRQMAEWRNKGYPLKPVAINFSGKQLIDREYISFLSNTLKMYNINPKYIEIEITESILMEETDNTLAFLNQLKEMGLKIAMDDFGTGYSSLNYLTFIPVDKIKLDKSLCEKFINMDNSSVISSLISLVHSLNLIITGEGIEEPYQYYRLKEGGCDLIQGYLFSKPVSCQEVEEIYNDNFSSRILL